MIFGVEEKVVFCRLFVMEALMGKKQAIDI